MSDAATDSYYRATAIAQTARPQLQGHRRADVCIIGAGYTGLSCALQLAKAGLNTIMLEAEHAAFGASGRNGGQVIPGQRVDQIELQRRYGQTHARALWDLASDARSLVLDLVEAHEIQCDVKPGHISAATKMTHAAELNHYVDFLLKSYNHQSARFVSAQEMPALVASSNYKGGMYDTAGFHLHPLNYALGLARAAEAAGATILENSRALSVEPGEKIRITTQSGTVSADFVVYACNGYLENLHAGLAATIMPISNYVAATERLGEARARALIPSGAAIADTNFVLNYYRLSADHRLIFGGGETYGAKDAANAGSIVRPCIVKVFPQLADVKVEFAWGGRLAITSPRLPHIGRLAPNIYFAQGYSGQGVAIATLTGKLIARAIGGQASGFDVMAALKIPAIPGGALFRKPLLKLALLWYALRDRLG